MWLSQVEEVSLKQTLVSGNRRFCILAIQLDSRKSPEKNHRTWKRHVDQMESTGIGIDSRYLRDPIPPARRPGAKYYIFGFKLTQSLSDVNNFSGNWPVYGLMRNEP